MTLKIRTNVKCENLQNVIIQAFYQRTEKLTTGLILNHIALLRLLISLTYTVHDLDL